MKHHIILALFFCLANHFPTFAQDQHKDQLKQFQKSIFEADSAFALAKNYTFALKKYQMAHEILPNEMYPQDKIIQTTHIILSETYNVMLAAANTCFENGNYLHALSYYNKAKEIFPDKPLPKNYDILLEKHKK